MPLSDDLLERIEAESRRLNHFYLGVEHLFLALLKLPNSLLADMLLQAGQSPAYVAYRLEHGISNNPPRRYWEGFRRTPRYEKVLALADQSQIDQTDLILAILTEHDSLPIRVMEILGIEIQNLRASLTQASPPQRGVAQLSTPLALSRREANLLQHLFEAEAQVEVLSELTAGVTADHRYIVRENRNYHVVRLDSPLAIMRETHQTERLPAHPHLAHAQRLTVEPSQQFAAIRYDLPPSQTTPIDLLAYVQDNGFHLLSQIFEHELYEPLSDVFWGKQQRYQLQLWREYEFILPPALVMAVQTTPPEERLIPLDEWSHNDEITVGMSVELTDFTVRHLNPITKSLWLQAGYGYDAVYQSGQIEVLGLENISGYSIGKNVTGLTGVIQETRLNRLVETIGFLNPPFAPDQIELETPLGTLINPILAVTYLLNYEPPAYLATIHGDFRLENLGVSDQAWVMNFNQLRQGHVLFDWVTLETSLLTDCLAPLLPDDSWDTIWLAAQSLQMLNQYGVIDTDVLPYLDELTSSLETIRAIASRLLAQPKDWREYFAPLALVSLSYLQHTTAPLGARRLAFASATLAAEAFRHANQTYEAQTLD